MSHIKLSPTDEAEAQAFIEVTTDTKCLTKIFSFIPHNRWVTLPSGTKVDLGYPAIFFYKNPQLMTHFIHTLTPSELAVFIDDEQVSWWEASEDEPGNWFWDDGDPGELFRTLSEYDEAAECRTLDDYGCVIQEHISELITNAQIDLHSIRKETSDDYEYWKRVLIQLQKKYVLH